MTVITPGLNNLLSLTQGVKKGGASVAVKFRHFDRVSTIVYECQNVYLWNYVYVGVCFIEL